MSNFKTPEEMNILIDMLNRGEITWDEIPQTLEKIRKSNVRSNPKNNKIQTNNRKSIK